MSNSIVFKIENDKGEMKQWKNVSIPVKYGKFLDEQLDHATVDLIRVKKKEFKLLSKASITIKDASGEEVTENYLIANDNSFEAPVGSGIYNHTLTLIELTKYLECFPLESLCFTNPNGNKIIQSVPNYKFYSNGTYIETVLPTTFEGFNNLKTPWIANTAYTLPNLNFSATITSGGMLLNVSKITIQNYNDDPNTPYFTTEFKEVKTGEVYAPIDNSPILKEGINEITYTYSRKAGVTLKEVFTVAAVASYLPLMPWTVERVIERILDLVEPLREGETPRFTFDAPEGKKSVFNQVAPEFTFTRMTLREALQMVGGYIHAEPRLTENNKIVFDFYGEEEIATYNGGNALNKYKYKTYQGAHSLEQACNTLDSYIDNLVNRISLDSGTVDQPCKGGSQTLRSETNYVRIEENDSTASFVTNFPIDSIKKFEYYNEDKSTWYDLTPYIYEKNIYDNLSSFDENYPYSKATALEFSYGQKGIRGFWFKNPDAIDQSFKNYSITNIINRATGNKNPSYNYQTLQFRLTYIPIYSTRVRQSKQNIDDWLNLPRTINYAQSDNSVETRFFGENIKGAVERLGNIENTVVMNMRKITNIPKAGQLWDNDYYISAVMVEVQQDLFEVSCSLSKNFNRISKYIGAKSHKRVYEVSETMVQKRHSVYTDYVLFTKEEHTLPTDKVYLSEDGVRRIASIIWPSTVDYTIGSVILEGQNKNKNVPQNKVILPVISSAFGNSIQFTWEYKDNYSAGNKSVYVKSEDEKVKGYFTHSVEYGDYYGRSYWQTFNLYRKGQISGQNALAFPKWEGNVPDSPLASTANFPILKRKDSRESLKETYNIEFVTNNSNFVIGSSFSSRNPLVHDYSKRVWPYLLVLKKRINKFSKYIDYNDVELFVEVTNNIWSNNERRFWYNGKETTKAGKAWCYVLPIEDGEERNVVDEEGEIKKFKPETKYELLFGENIDVEIGNKIGAFNAYVVHDVYDFLKNKTN